MSKCKQECRWGTPAKIFDGPVLHDVSAVKLAAKRAAKGSPEAARLQALLTGQQKLCWACGKRVSDGEAARLSYEARFIEVQRR